MSAPYANTTGKCHAELSVSFEFLFIAEEEVCKAYRKRTAKSNNIVCTHYVKVFCILCLSIIPSDTSKASENLTLVLKPNLILSSFCACVSIIICCLAAMKIGGSVEEMIQIYFKIVMYILKP